MSLLIEEPEKPKRKGKPSQPIAPYVLILLLIGGAVIFMLRFFSAVSAPDEISVLQATQTAVNAANTAISQAISATAAAPAAGSTRTALMSNPDCVFEPASMIGEDILRETMGSLMQNGMPIGGYSIESMLAGENCVIDGDVQGFIPMATDFNVSAIMTTPDNLEGIALVILGAYDAIAAIDPDTLSEPPGIIHYFFADVENNYLLSTTFEALAEAHEENLTGEDLIDALGGLR